MSGDYLVGKELVILFFECVVEKTRDKLSFPPGVYVGTLNLIASIPGPSVLTFFVIRVIICLKV